MNKPWGKMWKLIHTKNFWLKFLFVKGRTSLQSHTKRDEWHFGIYKVPKDEKHRLLKGSYIELAFGEPEEDDVIRYEDDYNRIKNVVVAISGGFDPIHVGHVKLFQEAKKLGTRLVVILNNDNWLRKKKGFVFMPEEERKEIIKAISGVDDVFLTSHSPDCADMSVCEELKKIRPHIFANGGDRLLDNIPEVQACNEINCKMVFNTGGEKIQSSSWLIKKIKKNKNNKINLI